LSEDVDTERIVNHLLQFDRIVPQIFSAVVMKELESDSPEIQKKAILKFSKFWKFTSKDNVKDQGYRPF
jgi:hypothetical protein